ncbi:MAG: hypothetical protein LBV52_06610 [Spirochaetaceae bacterium]|nr:hypothetical protein [Spirochaetaceae bacterium]
MRKLIVFFVVTTLLLTSCLGLKTNIVLKKDGSGTVAVEYSISKGVYDIVVENSDANTIPLGKEDFEEAIEDIDGLKLDSYKVREDDTNRIFDVEFSFKKTEALMNFLETQTNTVGPACTYKSDNGKNILTLAFSVPNDDDEINDMKMFAQSMFEGYKMDFSINLPAPCTVRYLNEQNIEVKSLPAGDVSINKNTVSYVSSMGDLITVEQPVIIELVW